MAWNKAQDSLYPLLKTLPKENQNLVWVLFCEPSARELVIDWHDRARSTLAEFRASATLLYGPQAMASLIHRLGANSLEFASWWPEHDVATFHTRLRRYRHPRAGELTFEYQQLTPSEWPHLRVICQLPLPGDDSAQRLCTTQAG